MPTTPTLSPLKAGVRALALKINDLDTYADDPGAARFKTALDQAAQLFEDLRNLVNNSKSQTVADFFHAVGSSIIEAQGRLDEASESYVRSALRLDAAPVAGGPGSTGSAAPAEGPPAMGTLFRIPRVTAELKCSLETTHSKGINVVFYSERNDIKELHQQTVQLEVVSVPVPPDYINFLKSQPPARSVTSLPGATGGGPLPMSEPGSDDPSEGAGPLPLSSSDDEGPPPTKAPPDLPDLPDLPSFAAAGPDPAGWLTERLADQTARQEVRALIEKLDRKQRRKAGRRRSPVSRLLLPAWSRALVFKDGPSAFFILLAVTSSRPRLLLWQLLPHPASLRVVYKLPGAELQQQQLAHLQRFLARLGKAQALASLLGS